MIRLPQFGATRWLLAAAMAAALPLAATPGAAFGQDGPPDGGGPPGGGGGPPGGGGGPMGGQGGQGGRRGPPGGQFPGGEFGEGPEGEEGEGGMERMGPRGQGQGGFPMPFGGEQGEGPGNERQDRERQGPAGNNGGPNMGVTGGGGVRTVSAKNVPCVEPKTKVTMDFVDAPVGDVVKYMAEITCRNFILSDELKGNVTIISHQQVTVGEAYEAFLSALEVVGYTTVTVGKNTKVVSTSEAASNPLKISYDGDIPATDNFVTQVIELQNVSVSEISSVVKDLSGAKARIIAYAPTNTLIITDAAYNIRRVYRIVNQLDVAAPKSKLEVITLKYATATDVERILEEIFTVASSSSSSSSSSSNSNSRSKSRGQTQATGASSTSVGSDASYISKIIADERTNSLIVQANEEALKAILDVVAKVDVDIDPDSRSQIHVIYLEHAAAEDVASVLSDLASQSTSSSSSSRSSSGSSSRSSSGSSSRQQGGQGGGSRSGGGGMSGGGGGGGGFGGGSSGGGFGGGSSGGGMGGGGGMSGGSRGGGPSAPSLPGGATGGSSISGGGGSSAVAAFDDGVRVTADENTNSLVIIAAPEDYAILKKVIDKLDIRRRQVFVEAVVIEVGSEDTIDLGIGYHSGMPGEGEISFGYGAAALGASTIGGIADVASTADSLTGLAFGVFGNDLEFEYTDPTSGTTIPITVPEFGIALNALAANSAVDILSNPSLLILDNEEAKINVGRNVPFPVSSGRDTNGNAIISYQREDVGITLQVTPQINEANQVTMELALEVSEVESSSSGDVDSGGYTTSERTTENVVVVDDNQTIVIGGLIGTTQTRVATKVPILGDLPLIGALFRGKADDERKTNLLIFLTPHVINEAADLEEVYRVKMLQRQEFLRRFYGKSRDEQQEELGKIMAWSMNQVDKPSKYRVKEKPHTDDGEADTKSEIEAAEAAKKAMKPAATGGEAGTATATPAPTVDEVPTPADSAPPPAAETTPEPAPSP